MTWLGAQLFHVHRVSLRVRKSYWRLVLGGHLQRNAASCGALRVNGYGQFSHVEHLHLGENIHVNAGAYWECLGGVTIGDHCHIARNLTIYSASHDFEGARLPYDEAQRPRPVTIGKNVWIGINVTILPGTTIGDGAVIGAGAVVFGTVAAGAIVGAAGSNTLRTRDPRHYNELEKSRSYGGVSGRPITDNALRSRLENAPPGDLLPE